MTTLANTGATSPTHTELRALDSAHHWHPFTDTKALADGGGSRLIVAGEGCWVTDSDGRRMLDAMAGLWCVNAGYGRTELADAAYGQMKTLPYYNAFFKTATAPAIELSARLVDLANRDRDRGLRRVFFGSSGSESIDTVVRLVRHFWNLQGKPDKRVIIGRKHGYHGSTLAGASLGGMAPMHRQAHLPLPDFRHIDPPYWFGLGGTLDPDVFGREAAHWLEAMIAELGAGTVAAFVAEPIQGAGGVIIPPDSYWSEIQRICKANDVLLVADEVICGFGRTGHWFGSDAFEITPDLMVVAKAITSGYLPLSAVLVGDKVAETVIEEGGEFYHGYTYSGHPTVCAVALANLDLLEREGLPARAAAMGPVLVDRLRTALDDHPLVGEVRGVGLIGAIELVKDKASRTPWPGDGKIGTMCRDHCFANDLIMRAVRDTMVFSPPLIISEEEIDTLVTRAKAAIDATARDLGVL